MNKPRNSGGPDERLSGTLERITFHNEETGFAVLQVKMPHRGGMVTIVGHVPVVAAGEYVDARGRWQTDRRYGLQFRALRRDGTALPSEFTGS